MTFEKRKRREIDLPNPSADLLDALADAGADVSARLHSKDYGGHVWLATASVPEDWLPTPLQKSMLANFVNLTHVGIEFIVPAYGNDKTIVVYTDYDRGDEFFVSRCLEVRSTVFD